MSSGDKEKHFDRQYSEHKLIQDCTHRLKQLGDDVFNAADYSESQLVRHADKAGSVRSKESWATKQLICCRRRILAS